jgi:hypothetical protein
MERQGRAVTGLVVHAGPGLLPSRTPARFWSPVQMLVPGSGTGLAGRGSHSPNGVPERWHLLAGKHT